MWVGRLGERDVLGWWATDGLLGPDGAFVGPRVLPVTHPTARARIVFAVAAHACSERHPDPKAEHLFRLDPWFEDRLDALLVDRLADTAWWVEQMAQLERVKSGSDIGALLRQAGVVTEAELARVRSLKPGPGGRSLPIPRPGTAEEALRLLAAGFARSNPRELVVPYLL